MCVHCCYGALTLAAFPRVPGGERDVGFFLTAKTPKTCQSIFQITFETHAELNSDGKRTKKKKKNFNLFSCADLFFVFVLPGSQSFHRL